MAFCENNQGRCYFIDGIYQEKDYLNDFFETFLYFWT